MQPDNTPSQSLENAASQNQQPEDLIRQGYTIQASGGQTFVVPDALQDVNLPLAKVLKPDFSKAVEMDGGVRFLYKCYSQFTFFCLHLLLWYMPNPDSDSDSEPSIDILAGCH